MAIADSRWRAPQTPRNDGASARENVGDDAPSGPIVASPVTVCETAQAANARLRWWMGIAVVAVGVAVGVIASRK